MGRHVWVTKTLKGEYKRKRMEVEKEYNIVVAVE